MRRFLSVLLLVSLLAGCDQLGIESATVVAEKRGADGKAIGAACRHAGRAIEDCYTLNKKAEKASVYAGWREMDDYMRENKLEPVVPVIKPEEPKPKPKPPAEGEDAADAEAAADAGDAKSGGKGHAKAAGGH
ncbi:hypothetical protein [Ideonella sp.]|uniref:hypothetical protein n=1 Tax=Ideonella sp. TaxID=1929293 RepID=UPI003BB62871